MKYTAQNKAELLLEQKKVSAVYQDICRQGLRLDLSRGKPSAEQLDLSTEMLAYPRDKADCYLDGADGRNYGLTYGLPAMQRFFSDLTGIAPGQIVVGGNSSLSLMYDIIAHAVQFGFARSSRPWGKEERIRFLCPAPGYDRHFAITELFGFELVSIPMTPTGPDMDLVEAAVKDDPTVKGIWCVPMYSNPTGVTYAPDTVRRLAEMPTAAPDFLVMWDNAYALHNFEEPGDELRPIFEDAKAAGHEDRVFYFTSTSKITFAGSGVAMVAASEANLKLLRPALNIRTIGYDKLNQIRHLHFLKDKEHTLLHMRRHAAVIKRKFEILLSVLDSELAGLGVAEWTRPHGGYFVSMEVPQGCAAEVHRLCCEAGVVLTPAGATFPYGKDPKDSNLRLAPSYPSDEEVESAARVLCCAVRLAALTKLLAQGE
ncbi:MAG: aminotransferase class I/II-fold pyridoxal phosphate-dependent enzyme [Eubacteriales bacterium]